MTGGLPDRFEKRARRQRRPGSRHRSQGFILIVVIWGLGVLSLLALSVIRSADVQTRIAANDTESAKVEALAEAAVNIEIFHLIASHRGAQTPSVRANGEPVFCRMPGALAALDIEDEGGKVDLNAASSELLAALFIGGGASTDEARVLVESVIVFRRASGDVSSAASLTPLDQNALPPKRSLFETVYELEQVHGMTFALFQRIKPFVTVYSRSAEVDPTVAAPKLLEMLSANEPADPLRRIDSSVTNDQTNGSLLPQFSAPSDRHSFIVRAEILGSDHTSFVREALVDFPPESPRLLLIREWRKGSKRFVSDLASFAEAAALPPC